MTMQGEVGLGAVRPMARMEAREILDTVLRRTEESFVIAGSDLVAAVDILRHLSELLDRLRLTFGAENGARLLTVATRARGNGIEITGGFDRFLTASEAVRQAVRRVRVEVDDLDRVVRTIANVSINARIQGNGLVPPRAQVSAFIERLGGMTAEAEGILAEVHEAMAAIGAEMAEMDTVTQDLREALTQWILPALARFDRLAQGVLDRQEAMAAANAGIALQMGEVNAQASRLVTLMQTGDSTRQRLERVRATVAAAAGSAHGAAILGLAGALSEAAVTAAEAEIATTVTLAIALCSSAETAVAQARGFYMNRTGAGEVGAEAERFDGAIGAVRQKLAVMRHRAADLRGRLGTILQHERALRQIGHQVRLSGLNAVLICAKLGEEGRALRELAQWLRRLTDESDAIVFRLQGALDTTAGLADALGGQSISAFEAALDAFFEEAAELGGLIGGIGRDRRDAARVFDKVGLQLPQKLGHAAQALTRFQHLLRDMAFFDAALAAERAALAPVPMDEAGQAEMAALRKGYTMQAEREVHDRFLGAAPAEAEPAAPAAGDDLDDILF